MSVQIRLRLPDGMAAQLEQLAESMGGVDLQELIRVKLGEILASERLGKPQKDSEGLGAARGDGRATTTISGTGRLSPTQDGTDGLRAPCPPPPLPPRPPIPAYERERVSLSLSAVQPEPGEEAWSAAAERMLGTYPQTRLGGRTKAERAVFEAFRRGQVRLDSQAANGRRSVTVSEWCAAVEAWNRSLQWQNEGGRFAKLLYRFLEDGDAFSPPPAPAAPPVWQRMPGEGEDAPAFSASDRLRALASSLPRGFAVFATRLRVMADEVPVELDRVNPEEIEARLSAMDVEMIDAAELSQDREDLAARAEATIAGFESRRLPRAEIELTRERLRVQIIREAAKLPVLSLLLSEG